MLGGHLFTPKNPGFWVGGHLLRGGPYSQLGGNMIIIIVTQKVNYSPINEINNYWTMFHTVMELEIS